jgi:hypothetical protein
VIPTRRPTAAYGEVVTALVYLIALRGPRPGGGFGRGRGGGFGLGHHSFGHFGSFFVHMAMWHFISRALFRGPGILLLVVLIGAAVIAGRRWTQRRPTGTGRPW